MKSFRILLVEGNQDLLDLIVKYLELCGRQASAANGQQDFWAAARAAQTQRDNASCNDSKQRNFVIA